jgi:anti-anti-sigma factor
MDIKVSKREGVVVLALNGRLDSLSSRELDQELKELMECGEKSFILDFENVKYISSAGLRSTLAATKRLKGMEGLLSITSLRNAVREVFEISGSISILSVLDTVESALEAHNR